MGDLIQNYKVMPLLELVPKIGGTPLSTFEYNVVVNSIDKRFCRINIANVKTSIFFLITDYYHSCQQVKLELL